MKALIAANAYLNEQKEDGWTALMLAARYDHTECVKALIAANAYLNEQKEDGWTSLMLAASSGHTECVKALLDAGADFNIKSAKGNSAEDLARTNKHTQVVAILSGMRKFRERLFSFSNYGIAGVFTALVILSILGKNGIEGSDDDIGMYVIGCLVPLFIKTWGATKAIGKPKDKKGIIIYSVADFFCVLALCLPALSNIVLEGDYPGFAVVAMLVHIIMGVLWYKKSVKQTAKAQTLVVWNIATAAILLYLAGGVITGSGNVFSNIFAALTLGYWH